MKKNRDYFYIPLCVALLFALIAGIVTQAMHTLPTSDWAAKGQPIFDRWLDKQMWFLEGAILGAIVGAAVGYIWYLYLYRNK